MKDFLNFCQESAVKFKSSKKLIEKCIALLEVSKEHGKILEAGVKIGLAMEKEEHLRSACRVFRKIKSPGDCLRCFEKIKVENQESALEYISYLADVYLFETAKKSCYDFCARFGLTSRQAFGELLKKVIEQEQSYHKSSKAENLLLS